jgi:phosphoribosylamine--glycine ligase
MGAYSPVSSFGAALERQVMQDIVGTTLSALAAEGAPYRGVLFCQLMLTREGPRVVEFNCRWGDPECEVVMPRLQDDLLPLLVAAARGESMPARVDWSEEAAVCVVMASGGYPGRYAMGLPIDGIDAAESVAGVQVFHAGTAERDGKLVTAGGRVLGVTATGPGLPAAIARAYEAAGKIHFEGMHYRRDIGHRALVTT